MEQTKRNSIVRVSDVIDKSEIKKWKNGDVITISAGCGSGKSYFIKNILYEIAKQKNQKILMLIHRTACVNQFTLEIEDAGKTDTIDIKTYQGIEYNLANGREISLDKYSYLISDEFHYFVEDSGFNCYTDISFNAIIGCQNAVKIFMSATGGIMTEMVQKFTYRKNQIYNYNVQVDFSYLKSLNFFFQPETMRTLAYRFKMNSRKAIFFCQSVQTAHSLYNEFRDCSLFLCGKNSTNGKKYYADVDEEKIKEMLINQRFEEQFLFTTSCFDAGANIIDTDLHTIVIDMTRACSHKCIEI